jgi:uncharacterized membrane protein
LEPVQIVRQVAAAAAAAAAAAVAAAAAAAAAAAQLLLDDHDDDDDRCFGTGGNLQSGENEIWSRKNRFVKIGFGSDSQENSVRTVTEVFVRFFPFWSGRNQK